jgi:hypothetical protein
MHRGINTCMSVSDGRTATAVYCLKREGLVTRCGCFADARER